MIKVSPDHIATATGDTLIGLDVGTGSFGNSNLGDFPKYEYDIKPGFVFMGNDTYYPESLHKAVTKKQYAASRGHTKRTYNSTRQLDKRYRNVTPAKN